MPLARVSIVVDRYGRAKGCAAIGAASEHYVGSAPAGWLHAGQHIDVIVGGGTRMVYCKETLSIQSTRIDPTAHKVTTHVNRSVLIKDWCLVAKLRIARARATKVESFTTDVEVAVAIHIKRSEYGLVRDING
jgi:hypothetical protein